MKFGHSSPEITAGTNNDSELGSTHSGTPIRVMVEGVPRRFGRPKGTRTLRSVPRPPPPGAAQPSSAR